MKNSILVLAIAAIGLMSFRPEEAKAASASAASYQQAFSTGNVLVSAWTEIVTSTGKAVKQITVFNTSENPVEIGVGAAGSEVRHLIVPQGTLPGNAYNGSPVGAYAASLVPIDLRIQSGQRVALRCRNSTCAKGEFQLNLIYQ